MPSDPKIDHEAARAYANELVQVPRYKLMRVEARLAKARAQRDAWRAKHEGLRRELHDALIRWHMDRSRKLGEEVQFLRRSQELASVDDLNAARAALGEGARRAE